MATCRGRSGKKNSKTVEKLGVRWKFRESLEQELHRLNLVRARERAAQLVDLRELLRGVKLCLFSRSRLLDHDRGKDPALEEIAVEQDLGIAGAFELLKNHFVHARACVDQCRRDDRERAVVLGVAGGAEESARLFHGPSVDPAR